MQGKDSGLAVGLWSSNTGEGSQNTFQATFDDILITSTGPSGQLVKAVNVGGGQVTASNGIVFEADTGPATGAAASQVFATTAGISGTIDDALYQNERWTPGGSYTYEVAVANGTYQVDLLLAGDLFGHHGSGTAACSTCRWKARRWRRCRTSTSTPRSAPTRRYTISQQVTVSDGSLSIQVGPGSSVTGQRRERQAERRSRSSPPAPYYRPSPTLVISAVNASQNEGNSGSTAVHLHRRPEPAAPTGASTASCAVAGSGANPATAADFTGSALPDRHGELRRRRDRQDDQRQRRRRQHGRTWRELHRDAVQPRAPARPSARRRPAGTILNDDGAATPTLVAAVNVGGGQVTASNGVVFQADAGPTTGAAASQVFSTTAGIAGTTDDALYQNERWTPGGSYTYESHRCQRQRTRSTCCWPRSIRGSSARVNACSTCRWKAKRWQRCRTSTSTPRSAQTRLTPSASR